MVTLGRQHTSIVVEVIFSTITSKQCNVMLLYPILVYNFSTVSSLLLYADVDLTEDMSPTPPLLPHIVVSKDTLNHSFFIPVVSNGNPVSWQLGGPLQYYSADSGTPQGITVQQLSGMVTVDTQYMIPGHYSVQLVITDLFTGLEVRVANSNYLIMFYILH